MVEQFLGGTLTEAESLSKQLYERHTPLIAYAAGIDFPLPQPLRTAVDFVLNAELRKELAAEPLDHRRIRGLLADAKAVRVEFDDAVVSFGFEQTFERLRLQWSVNPRDPGMLERIRKATALARSLPFAIDLTRMQNSFFRRRKDTYPTMREQADSDEAAARWVEGFEALGELLKIRV